MREIDRAADETERENRGANPNDESGNHARTLKIATRGSIARLHQRHSRPKARSGAMPKV